MSERERHFVLDALNLLYILLIVKNGKRGIIHVEGYSLGLSLFFFALKDLFT